MNFGKFIWLKAFKGQNLVCVFATDAEIWCKLSGLQSKKLSCRQVNVETLRSWRARSTLVSALTIWSVKVGCKELKGEKTGYFVPNQPCPPPQLTAQTRYYHHPQIWPNWYIFKDSIQPIRLLQLNYRTIFNWQICSSMQPDLKRDCSPQVPTTSQSPQQNCLFWSPDHIGSDWHWIVK